MDNTWRWATLDDGQYLPMDNTQRWTILGDGQYLAMGNTCEWRVCWVLRAWRICFAYVFVLNARQYLTVNDTCVAMNNAWRYDGQYLTMDNTWRWAILGDGQYSTMGYT